MSQVVMLEPFTVYHPRNAGGGNALKLEPVVGRMREDRWKAPGAYLQIAQQAGPLKAGRGAPFAWDEALRFMLGLRDVLALRMSYHNYLRGMPNPQELVPPKVSSEYHVCSLVHRTPQRTTILQWSLKQVDENVQFIRVQSGDAKAVAKLSAFEGYQFNAWLEALYPWMLQQTKPWRDLP